MQSKLILNLSICLLRRIWSKELPGGLFKKKSVTAEVVEFKKNTLI